MTLDDSSAPDAFASSGDGSFTRLALAGSTTSFALIGAMSSVYGPLLVTFSHKFALSLPTAGEALAVHFIGALVGVLVGWLGVRWTSGRTVIVTGMLSLALGTFGAAAATGWSTFLPFVFLIGLGFGALDSTTNTLLARTAFDGRARRLSFVNAGYGVGAVIGPLLVIALGPHNFPTLFIAIGCSSVLLSTTTGGIHAPALHSHLHHHERVAHRRARRPILVTFVIAYILYVAVETSSSGWMAAQLHREGYSQSDGSLITAGFWVGMTIGRFSAGPLYRRFGDQQLILGGLGVASVLAFAATSHVLALVAYPLLGLALASVFPMGIIWYTNLVAHDNDGLAMMILFMMIGGVLGPSLVGYVVSQTSIHEVPYVVTGLCIATLAAFGSARRFRSVDVRPAP